MINEFPKWIKQRRGSSDMPVIVVALSMAFLVILFVSIFLYLLPNWQTKKKLEKQFSFLEIIRAERQSMVKNTAKYREEIAILHQDEKKLTSTFSEKNAQTKLKEDLTKVFLDNGYVLQAYHLGSSQKGDSPLWIEAPLDFTVTGPTEKLEKTLHLWRSTLPVHVRLFDVEIRKQETAKKVRVIVNLAVHFLNPLDSLEPRKSAPDFLNPSSGAFESARVKELRAQLKKVAEEIRVLEASLGEVGSLQERRKRLEAVLSKRADFSAQRERDFDQLEGQVKRILPKLGEKDHYKIVLKVKETQIQKSKE